MNPNPLLRALPSVDQLLTDPGIRNAARQLPPEFVATLVRRELDGLRSELKRQATNGSSPHLEQEIETRAREACRNRLQRIFEPQLTAVINATGVIIHTGLGRSPLSQAALDAVVATARGYCDVAISRESGGRRNRSSGVEELLRLLTGCEAALVTNNNAAATMLALHTFAHDCEVIVSRGQLVEIGGSFRLPEVMTSAGSRLREVGTTNRTRLADYESGIGEQTGALMRIHPSNYQIVGFTETVEIAPLAELAHRHGLPVIDDIGSGALIDFSHWGLSGETPARASVAAGSDLVLFSGDKLLGGPQAGILIGKREAISRCARNPLMRALRVDKMTVAALEATLRLYLEPERLSESLPLIGMITAPLETIRARGERLLQALQGEKATIECELQSSEAYVGGGSLPDQRIPSFSLVVTCDAHRAERVKRALRLGDPSVFCRVRKDHLEFDLRTVQEEEIDSLAAALQAVRFES